MNQAALRELVRRHVLACAQEAATADFAPGYEAGSRVAAALVVLARSAAWSLGSTLCANGIGPGEAADVMRNVLHEFEQEFLRGFSDPTGGTVVRLPGTQSPARRADCPAPLPLGYSGHAETPPTVRPVSEDDRGPCPRDSVSRVHPQARRSDEPGDTASPTAAEPATKATVAMARLEAVVRSGKTFAMSFTARGFEVVSVLGEGAGPDLPSAILAAIRKPGGA